MPRRCVLAGSLKKNSVTYTYVLSWQESDQKIDATHVCTLIMTLEPGPTKDAAALWEMYLMLLEFDAY